MVAAAAAIQHQWKTLWETQSPAIVDPADVVSVLDSLRATTINRNLSPVQLTLLQRRVRAVVKHTLPKKSEQGTTSKKIAKVFAAGTSSTDSEARNAIDKYHVLTPTVLQRVLPSHPTVSDSIIMLMLALSFCRSNTALLTDRVLIAAKAAAEQAGLEMDVNKQQQQMTTKIKIATENASAATDRKQNGQAMPKPSQVSVLDEPVEEWPIGASFCAVATILALATGAASRTQRLQLLFYALMDVAELREFLALHPAGGVPVWLLEVGNNTVVSLPSLTHYHYYGTAFLPCEGAAEAASINERLLKPPTPAVFVASKSHVPVKVSALKVQRIVGDAYRRATAHSSMNGSSSHNHNNNTNHNGTSGQGGYPLDEKRPASSPKQMNSMSLIGHPSPSGEKRRTSFRRSSSANDLLAAESSVDPSNVEMPNGSNKGSIPFKTTLMMKLRDVSDGIDSDPYSRVATELDQSYDRFEATTAEFVTNQRQTAGAADFQDSWTLQDFRQWADAALDDLALDVVMHRLFLEGILPSPSLERELVLDKWLEWQVLSSTNKHDDGRSVTEMLTNSVSALLGSWQMQPSNGENHNHSARLGVVWGGLGGIDGLGGIGHGVMYCIPAAWWDSWTDYTGWSFVGERPHKRPKSRSRPASLETESLLEQDPEYVIRGIYGSYEVMRQGLRRGRDYVLVPPGVWDMLFELYSGGPPLPRMVKSPDSVARDPLSALEESNNLRPGNNSNDELDEFMGDLGAGSLRVMRIPDRLSVETHPWILHVHLCDPLQPYRRGDTGPLSIRVMASPNQSLWRLFSEIACRFSLQSYKAFNADGRGIARLWKKMDANEAKDSPLPRYGPWNLLCKGRHAMLPLTTNGVELGVNYDAVISDWKQFGDDATVESIGLTDQESLILEFAVQNKNGDLTWPREAAAKAGKVRRLAEEDKMFRQLLRGVDDEGNLLAKAPNLVGLDVDAMDQSGRWYTVKILDVEVVDFDTDEDNEDDEESGCPSKEQTATKKKVKVNFKDHGGHSDWIDVESDRLQDAGRFASECNLETSTSPTNSNAPNGESRAKSLASAKRASSHTESTLENTKSCALPGFGSCGLTNLGNTCYMNSAVQCMAYLPLLRAYLLGSQYKATGDLNKDNPLGTGGKLLEEFAELQRSVWSARVAEKSPNRFRMQLGKTNDQFAGADQQDAQEFLNYMIDVLHEDSNKVRKKPFVEPLDDKWVEMANLPRVGEEAWRR